MDHFRSIKVITLGPSAAGKTSILMRATLKNFTDGQDYKPTIGVDFKIRECKTEGRTTAKMHIWDTAGQERFQQINRMYYRDVDAALFIFDLSSSTSFHALDFYWSDFHQFCQPERKCFCILVGNKSDLQPRQVTALEAETWAKVKEIPYLETSARTGENVDGLFDRVLSETLAKTQKMPANTSSTLQRSVAPPKKRRFC